MQTPRARVSATHRIVAAALSPPAGRSRRSTRARGSAHWFPRSLANAACRARLQPRAPGAGLRRGGALSDSVRNVRAMENEENLDELDETVVLLLGYAVARAQAFEGAVVKM